ncbi:hypothetical protein GGS26DRAFT_604039 [Hypomontagnella submonticulosa]|nr:hypothetical protein GGS26DRAFT_604039 [Hypomontagnella submonticulosa]
MAATADLPLHEPPPSSDAGKLATIWKKLVGKDSSVPSSPTHTQEPRISLDSSSGSGLMRRVSRKVVPGLPRAKTFKRQQSEVREKLEAILPTSAERRAVSVDRRIRSQRSISRVNQHLPRASAPDFLDDTHSPISPSTVVSQQVTSAPESSLDEKQFLSLQDVGSVNSASIDREHHEPYGPAPSYTEALSPPMDVHMDVQSTTTSQYDAMINDELERKWILNLSMHFRDKSRREKFFVTYREDEYVWRRVTISLDYRNAPDDSLEKDLLHIKFQREKSSKIYEAIRESLQDIQFYNTVTNLKLQTTDGRLHVHVVEDVNEIINYPTVRMIQHLKCRRVRERDLVFDSHMSGFVYKVRVGGQTLIKKEIPGPDTVDEFLYEVNALNSLRFSRNIIEFYGVVVDDEDEFVKGLLINFAERGALIDVIYDSQEEGSFLPLPWSLREKWARQIVQGLSDVHEAGFVQGDLTLSNIVIDRENNAKIIDINRRGCPVGWEPPEATPLIDSNQRISMYIGVKSDLYQLGMVLWALATLEDEPEAHRRPLRLDSEIDVPGWYRRMVEYCLHEDPRVRLQATVLLDLFPQTTYEDDMPSISVDDGFSLREYTVDGYHGNGHSQTKTVQPRNAWPYAPFGSTHTTSPGFPDDSSQYPSRGRSPARSLPSNQDAYDPVYTGRRETWPSDTLNLPTNDTALGAEERAETPRKLQIQSDIVANLERDLSQLEADQEREQEREREREGEVGQDATTSGENQTSGAALPTGADGAPEIAEEKEETALPKADRGTTAVTSGDSQTTTSTLGENPTSENPKPESSDKVLSQHEVSQTDEPRDVGTVLVSTPVQTQETVQPPTDEDGEVEPLDFTDDRRGDDTPTRSTEAPPLTTAESPPRNVHVPAELMGVGSIYEKQEDCRKGAFSDEDLGLSTAATPPNVSSQA